MKRKKLTWLFCLFFAAFFFLVPAVAHASAKDDIGKYDVTVNILKNGDAKVTHEITYNLSKKAHQLTLPQSISGIDDVYAVNVSVVSSDGPALSNVQAALPSDSALHFARLPGARTPKPR